MDRVQWHYLRLRMWPARGVDGADDHADGRMAGENLNLSPKILRTLTVPAIKNSYWGDFSRDPDNGFLPK